MNKLSLSSLFVTKIRMIVAAKIVHLYNSTFSEQAFTYQSHFMDVLMISLPSEIQDIDIMSWNH